MSPLSSCSIRWCGPCKILGPRLEKLVSKLEGKVLMAKVDIDDHTDLAIEYEVGGGRAQISLADSVEVHPRGELCLSSSCVGGEGKPRAYRFLIHWIHWDFAAWLCSSSAGRAQHPHL